MPDENGTTFRWLGVAGVELTSGDHRLIIDPYLTRFGFLRQWVGPVFPDRERVRSAVPRSDVVLVTHSHWDHLLDVPEIVRYTGATVVGSSNTAQLLALLGVERRNVVVVQAGRTLRVHDFQVLVCDARHMRAPGFGPGELRPNLRPPLRARDYRMDQLFCFQLEVNGIRLTTEPGDGPWQARQTSVLLLSPRHTEDRLAAIIECTRPKTIIPYHWDDMYRPLSKPLRPMMAPPTFSFRPFRRMDLHGFQERVRRIDPRLRVFLPDVMETYALQDLVATGG